MKKKRLMSTVIPMSVSMVREATIFSHAFLIIEIS